MFVGSRIDRPLSIHARVVLCRSRTVPSPCRVCHGNFTGMPGVDSRACFACTVLCASVQELLCREHLPFMPTCPPCIGAAIPNGQVHVDLPCFSCSSLACRRIHLHASPLADDSCCLHAHPWPFLPCDSWMWWTPTPLPSTLANVELQ